MSMIDMMYRPQPPTFGGPIWVAPNHGLGGWGDTFGPREQRYGPIHPPQPAMPIREPTEEERERLMEALRQLSLTPITITTDGTAGPAIAPAQAAPAPAPEPEGVSTEDSFRPGRKLDLD